MSRVVVIGGGVAGLATAALLARDRHTVTLVERRDVLGGRAGTWERDGFTFDTGPSWYLMPECFEHFFGLLGTRVEDHLDLVDLDPAYRVFGEAYETPLDVVSGRDRVRALFESVEPGAGEAIGRYLDSAREAYELAVGSFLYTTFSRVPARTLAHVLPRAATLSRLLLESLHARAARTVADTRLRQILGYPAVFLAATPRTTPSLYHLMSAMDLEDGVRYPLGGFTRLVQALERLAREAGVEIRTGDEVTAIRTARRPGRRALATGVTLRTGEDGGRLEQLDAEVVVSTADLHHTETALLPAELRTYPAATWRRRTSGPGAVLALLGVEGRLPELTHHNLFFTEDWDANFAQVFAERPTVPDPASLYVCKPSATDPSIAPSGTENLFVLIPVSPDAEDGESIGRGGVDRHGEARVEAAADAAIAQIAGWAGIPDLAERVRVRRTIGPGDFAADFHSWRGNALGPGHTLRQSAFLRGSNASRKVAGLLYAGATTVPGVGLPMCLISAENVLKRMRGDTSDGPLPEDALGTSRPIR
ncbi:phytoene desaturase family protein [Brachybacterium huguangmaarense]|uniref:Phytoene desaturase family protein n=1 Tax=Brachybacterium huguangmaarense TaxID=1652028 RepID=A0ABY6G2Z3_9MICO|nr:phytoene desaturase family protein [Brachybacterium huguangmaarense]UYG17460.1 phytoene desaturase family protein [Brachybacterium huguangmaarense]